MDIYMSPHSGCYNHGCEAIVRSTIDMLSPVFDNISLYSSDVENDTSFEINKICKLIPNISDKKVVSVKRKKIFALKEHLLGQNRDIQEIVYRNKGILKSKNAAWLSIGGDNYCYSGMQQVLSEQLQLFSNKNIPCILWGCSVEESLLSKKVIGELEKYSLITVRESLSYDILMRAGINSTDVALCSDPAFTLKIQKTDLYSDCFYDGNCIGLNVSSLNKRYDFYENATYNNFKTLINHILKNTKRNVILIPHVRQPGNDDLEICKKLAEEINSNRITVVSEDLNCMQLKYIISKCSTFVGCRTHSTIAAYSTCVPTLVVGYSTKAKGIAKDIFGDYSDLLVDARDFKTDNDLLNKFLAFYERKDELKLHLQKVMPEYINRAYLAKDALIKML